MSNVLHEKQNSTRSNTCLRVLESTEGTKSRENETEVSVAKSAINIIKSDLQLRDIIEKDDDICHRIGSIDGDCNQSIIITFTKHSTLTKVIVVVVVVDIPCRWRESPNGFIIKLLTVKTCNQFNGYVSYCTLN